MRLFLRRAKRLHQFVGGFDRDFAHGVPRCRCFSTRGVIGSTGGLGACRHIHIRHAVGGRHVSGSGRHVVGMVDARIRGGRLG